MMGPVSILNKTMELKEYQDKWFFDEKHNCWCLEDLIYTPVSKVPAFQRLSIYAPKELLNADGSLSDKAKIVPVVFENSAAGYMQMPHTWLDAPRCHAHQYLDRGYVYVTCGCSGRESRDASGKLVGKCPSTLVDLKTAIRFLRHNKDVIPGDLDKIISVGTSAGGAMSSLLGVTGDNENYLPFLRENGAFMDESDAVFAAQIYCPIADLEHADLAYEWMFQADKTCESSHAGPAETMSPFKEALSAILAKKYIEYFNALELKNPENGEVLQLNADGRSGSGYDYLMKCFDSSATKYLNLLQQGKLKEKFSVEEYISGNYTFLAPAPKPPRNPDAHHIGPGADLPKDAKKPMTLGEMMCRPPRGVQMPDHKPPMVEQNGTDKREWLSWDGEHAHISDLDTYVLHHRRRMKPCTSFDTLPMNSGENQAFGTAEADFVHFNPAIGDAIGQLKECYPEEYDRYYAAFAAANDEALLDRVRLFNPMAFIGTAEKSNQAKHYRIRVGAKDADTSTTISMTLALKLANAGCGSVDYALVWDQPHCDADYPGEVCDWIGQICR